VGGVAAHAVGERDLLAGGSAHHHALVVAHQLAVRAHEQEADRAPLRGPGQAHLGQAVAEVEHDEGRVLDAVLRMAQGPHGGLQRGRLPEHRAQLVEDVCAVVVQDPASGELAVGAPGGRPVGVAGVGLGAVHLVLDQVHAADARQQAHHGLPLRGVVVLVAGDEDDARRPDRGRDRLGVGQALRDRLLAQHVQPARSCRFHQCPVRERRRAHVDEVERLAGQQLFGLLVEVHARERLPGGVQVGPRQVGGRYDLDLLPERSVARPLRRVAAQRYVAGAQQGASQLQRQPPSRASRAKASSRMPSATSAVASSMVSGGFTRNDGL
jgi:hypothetical protein